MDTEYTSEDLFSDVLGKVDEFLTNYPSKKGLQIVAHTMEARNELLNRLVGEIDDHQHLLWQVAGEEALLDSFETNGLEELEEGAVIHLLGLESRFFADLMEEDGGLLAQIEASQAEIFSRLQVPVIWWAGANALEEIKEAMPRFLDNFQKGPAIDEAKERSQELLTQEQKAKTSGDTDDLHQYGRLLSIHGLWKESLEAYKQVLETWYAEDDPRVVKTLANLGGIFLQHQWAEKALRYYERAKEIPVDSQNARAMGTIFYQTGRIAFRDQQFADAMEQFEAAIAHYEGAEDTEALGDVYHDMAQVYVQSGQSQEAIGAYGKAASHYQEIEKYSDLATIYKNVALLHERLGNLDKAIELYRSSIQANQRIEDMTEVVSCYQQIGSIHQNRREWEAATEAFEAALPIAQDLGDDFLEAAIEDSIDEVKGNMKGAKKKKGLLGGLFGK